MSCKGSPGKNEGVTCCLLWCAPTVHTRCLNFRDRATLRSYTVNTKIQILALDYRYSILLILSKHCLFFLLVSSTGTTTSFARSTLYFIVLRGKKKQIFSGRDFPHQVLTLLLSQLYQWPCYLLAFPTCQLFL